MCLDACLFRLMSPFLDSMIRCFLCQLRASKAQNPSRLSNRWRIHLTYALPGRSTGQVLRCALLCPCS